MPSAGGARPTRSGISRDGVAWWQPAHAPGVARDPARGRVAPDAGRAELLAAFEATDALVVPVVEDGRVVGELHADDVLTRSQAAHTARRRRTCAAGRRAGA